MERYEAINEYIRQARLERSVLLAEITAEAIVSAWKAIKYVAEIVLSVARARNPKGVFTFDA